MTLTSGMFSAARDDWATPQAFFDELHREFLFTLDPCATAESAKCARYFTRETDGLVQSWAGERVFMNPPYGRVIGRWLEKAVMEAHNGTLVVCLIPARTDTAWWHDCVIKHNAEVRFVRGRLQFVVANKVPDNAPFPCAVAIFRPPA